MKALRLAQLRDGRCGIAFPVFDLTNSAVAAVTAVCTTSEWAEGFEQRIAPELRDLAVTISRFLGFEGGAGIC